MGNTAVAKKKKPGPVARPEDRRDSVLAVKCREDYKEWVQRLADQFRMNPSQLVDVALVKLAQEAGFEPPPKR